jgi:dihydrofolate reductase
LHRLKLPLASFTDLLGARVTRNEASRYAANVLRLIAAVDEALGVANDHGIPWQGKIPKDAHYFREQTTNGVILMGYGTYKEFDKPLHDRVNYVVSRPDTGELRPGFVGVPDAANFLRENESDLVWVVGGAALFAATIASADQLFLTRVDRNFHCTKFFPTFSDAFELASDDGPYVESGISFHFEIWRRTVSLGTKATESG